VLHNAVEQPDGTWRWRYQRHLLGKGETVPDFGELWDDLDRIEAPILLVRGGDSPVVTDDDAAQLRERKPGARVEVMAGAGHSVQGDRPVELAGLIDGFSRATMGP